MTVSLDGLQADFRSKIEILITQLCKQNQYTFRITYALRTPLEQARLWRQGRNRNLIESRINDLEALGCDYMAECLHIVGPQTGKSTVTNALPGQSWHQWGEAADFAAYDGAKYLKDGNHEAYDLLALKAQNLSLTNGKTWGDAGHIQYSKLGKPQYSLQDINDIMRDRFGKV